MWLILGAAYFFDLTGETGTRCVLTDAAVQFGTLLAGGLSTLEQSASNETSLKLPVRLS